MKTAQKFGYFILGALFTALLLQTSLPDKVVALAKAVNIQRDVSVYVDKVKLDPVDTNSDSNKPIVYNGCTYLPVRTLSQVFDKPVTWDESSKSVYIGTYDDQEPDVLLSDLDYFYAINNTFMTEETEKDNLGNTQKNVVYGSFNRTYKIEAFSRMTGVLFQKYEHRSDLNYFDSSFIVYGDDKLLYREKITGGMEPIEFDIDLTGITEIQVVFKSSTGYNFPAALGNVGLYK